MNLTRFPVGDRFLSVDRAALRGVVPSPGLSPVPDAPAWIVGAYNNLGRAVAAVDAAALLGLGAVTLPPAVLLLVQAPSGLIGLVADGSPDEVRAASRPRRGAVVEVVDRASDLLRVDLALFEGRMEAALAQAPPDTL